jgi:hypothetical protein
MAFKKSGYGNFYQLLKDTSRESEIFKHITAENFLLEERLTPAREDNYHRYVGDSSDTKAWEEDHKRYVEEKIYLHKETPETFTQANHPNILPAIDDQQYLVRLENAAHLERFHQRTIDRMMIHFRDFIKGHKKAEKTNIINDLFVKWNEARDLRPMFVGFWGEVEDLFVDEAGDPKENKDWANQLRDRFGLGHLDPLDAGPIPVVMFRYRVEDVIRSHKDEPLRLAVPTVLDSKLSPFFCPTPKNGWEYGQALDLTDGGEQDYSFYYELLHRKIEYKPDFLFRAGWITGPPGKTLEKARHIHLAFLRDEFEKKVQ